MNDTTMDADQITDMNADQIAELTAWLRKRLKRDLLKDNWQRRLLVRLLEDLDIQLENELRKERHEP